MSARVSRRRLMGGAAAGLGIVTVGLPVAATLAQEEQPFPEEGKGAPRDDGDERDDEQDDERDDQDRERDEDGGRSGDPGARGIQLLRDWVYGEIVLGDLPLQPDWTFFILSTGTGISYPPSWTVREFLDPDIFDNSDGNLNGAILLSPDEAAAVLMSHMTLDPSTSVVDAGWSQMEQFVGSGKPTPLVEEELPPVGDLTWAFLAGEINGVVCAGRVLAMPDVVNGGAFFTFNFAAARAEDFDLLTEEVMLPILLSQVTSGGGGGAFDPTPEPEEDTGE